MDSSKTVVLKRLLSTELSSLKAECAQLSNDVREVVSLCEADLKTMCDALLKSCKEVNRERDEAVRLYKLEETRRRECLNQLHILKGNIRVVCRIRPVNRTDEEKGSKDIAVLKASREVVRCQGKNFEFDEVFGPKQTNVHVFDEALPMVESVFEGFHACIFAYGQTGSGKTFTMSGSPTDRGVNYRAVERLFEMRDAMLASGMYSNISFFVSNVEIYNETVRDLLGKAGDAELQIRQDMHNGIHLPGCTRVRAENTKAVWETMESGQRNRAQALTKMNSESSRSHSVFIVEVEAAESGDGSKTIRGKLILVDLAGSERLSKSGVSGERQREAQNINKSLSALGDVICALGAKSSHVPFRNSKLTYLLQDSMSKQNKVMMIVQTAPTLYNVQESLCTLSFGARARAVELGRAEAKVETENIGAPAPAAPLPATTLKFAGNTSMTKQHNDLLMQKMQLEQKLLSMERALGEAEARASLAEKACAKKEDLIIKAEREKDELLARLNTQLKVGAVRKNRKSADSTSSTSSSNDEQLKRQIEREKAVAQVKARLAEQERVQKEARERMMGSNFNSTTWSAKPGPVQVQPIATPSRHMTSSTSSGAFLLNTGGVFGSMEPNNKAISSLPLPPPMSASSSTRKNSVSSVSTWETMPVSKLPSLVMQPKGGISHEELRGGNSDESDDDPEYEQENRFRFSAMKTSKQPSSVQNNLVPRKLQTSFGPTPTPSATLFTMTSSSGARPNSFARGNSNNSFSSALGTGPARVSSFGGSVIGNTAYNSGSSGSAYRRF